MIRVFSQYIAPKSVVRVVLETGLIALALLCGARLRFWDNAPGFESYVAFPDFAAQAAAFVGTLQVGFYCSDLYNLRALPHRREQLISIGHSLGIGCLLLGLMYFIFPSLLISRGVCFISVALVAVFVTVSRTLLDRLWQVAAPKANIAILGMDHLALDVAREVARRDDLNVALAGFIALREGDTGAATTLSGRPILGASTEIQEIVAQHGISRIVVALEDRRNALPVRDLVRLRVQGVVVEDAHSLLSSLTGRVWLSTVKPSWFVFSGGFHRSRLTLALKRFLDLTCATLGLLLSAPLMALLAIAIRLDSKGPVFYRQTRVGLRGECFEVLKLRSMRTDAEKDNGAQWAADQDPRITRIGRFLRKYRLDEMPQFINIIRGDMSFVGPRPERPVFVEQLREQISYYDERHTVRPGLTGWAQVQFHYGSTVQDAMRKLEYDLFYLKNMSVLFDSAIILKTVRIVLTGTGGK